MTDFRYRHIQRAISALVDRQDELEAQGRQDEIRLVRHDIEALEAELCYLEEVRRGLSPLRKDGNLYDELVDLRREEEQQYCPRCGHEITETDVALCLCPNCGARVCEGVV